MTAKGVLLVDDEAKALKYFTRAFSRRFPVFSASSAREALEVLAEHSDEIGVIVTDQRMPESSGVELLKIVRRQYPRTVRILTTAFSELDLLIEAINSGAVYSFVTKPWQLDDLAQTLAAALEHYEAEVREHEKLEQKLVEFREQIREGRTYDVAVIAAKIGHYIHNALCPVTLILDQMLEEDGGASISNEFVASVNRHVHEVSRTLKDLGQLSDPPLPDDFEKVDIAVLLRRAIDSTGMLRREKALDVELHVTDALPAVRGVPEQLEKLFRFMISEEVVSLPAGSRLKIEVSAAKKSEDQKGVRVVFEDFEPIRPDACGESLLHPFNPRGANPREFGVFLSSSYLIAHHHGGDLEVTVKPNRSLLFSFYFPQDRGTLRTVRRSGGGKTQSMT